MKKVLLALIFSQLVLSSTGQDKKNEIFLGIGAMSTSIFTDIFSEIIVSGITGGVYSSNSHYSPTFHVGYKYLPYTNFAIGGIYTYVRGRSDAMTNGEPMGTFTNNYHTLGFDLQYKYINRPRFSFYSLAGLGATLYHQRYKSDNGDSHKNHLISVDFQLSLIGFEYGSNWGFRVEAGFGYKGIINLGAFLRL